MNDKHRAPRALAVVGGLLASVFGCEQITTLPDNAYPSAGGVPIASVPVPAFGTTQTSASPPPAISGGTLLIAADGHTAIAADPDRDAVYVVDLAAATKSVATILLAPGDEPGRVIEDGAGLVHVVLRGGGTVADIDPSSGRLQGKRAVCPAPRGIAYDDAADQLVVACAGGELVRLTASATPGATGKPVSSFFVAPDLRDVVLLEGKLFVSLFRSAALLQVGPSGSVLSMEPANSGLALIDGTPMNPVVAWRTVAYGGTGSAMVHQQARAALVPPTPGSVGYYGQGDPSCGTSISQSTITFFDSNGQPEALVPLLADAVLPVDLAFSRDLTQLAFVAAGNAHTRGLPTVTVLSSSAFKESTNPCEPFSGETGAARPASPLDPGEPTSVAFDGQGRAVVLSREPAMLYFHGSTEPPIVLSGTSREDTGHAIFHSNSSSFLACASCHAEGGEDGHVWILAEGIRRTQSLRGTIEGTAPYHWGGELGDIPSLVQEVYVTRMGGPTLESDQVGALQSYLFTRPRPQMSAPEGPGSATRGEQLFQSAAVGCASCHSGPKLTNNATIDVGTGGPFQVPSLVGVAWRAPYMQTGCAATLYDRFDLGLIDPATGDACGGRAHGNTSQLTTGQIDDLVAYLQTL